VGWGKPCHGVSPLKFGRHALSHGRAGRCGTNKSNIGTYLHTYNIITTAGTRTIRPEPRFIRSGVSRSKKPLLDRLSRLEQSKMLCFLLLPERKIIKNTWSS